MQIQQHSPNATQVARTISQNPEALGVWLKALESKMLQLGLPQGQVTQLEADAATVHTQLTAPSIKWTIVRESIASITTILEGAAGNMLAATLLEQLKHLA